MASPKALILQGILGVAGLCASGAGGIGLGLGKAFKGVQSDAPDADDSSVLPKPAEITKVKENSDLGIPKECEGSCSLSAEQLKKLKFEKKGDEKIEFEGLGKADEFELIIEESSDSANYPRGKKYTLRPKTIGGTVTIKNIKEGDIVLGKDQEVLIREVIGGGKLEHLLEEVNGLGIPRRCKADEVTGETKTCDLTKLQLQKLNFERRGNEKITVEGLDEGNVVTLKIEDKGDDRNNYPWGKKYTLRSATGDVTIKGVKEGDIILGKDQEVLIRETSEGGKLEHLLEELNELGIPKRCVDEGAAKPCELKQKQLKDLKFEAKEGTSISVNGGDGNSKFELIIEDKPNDKENYPKGKKYTIRSTGTSATIRGVKEVDIHIWEKQSVVVRETEEGGKLEMAPEEVDALGIPVSCTPGKTCQLKEQQIKNLKFEVGDGGITVEGIKEAKVVELKVEDKSRDTDNYPKGKKYTLSAGKTVTIKGLKDGNIEIGTNGGVVIREKENEQKLEKAPEEIDHLLIPKRCNTGATCHLTKGELQRIKFETRGNEKISIDGLNDGNKVDLKVETEGNVTDYPKKKKYTFTSKTGKVTIAGTKDGNIVLEQNKAVIFREIKEGNKLETYLDVLGIPRPWGGENIKEGSEPETYYFSSDKLKDLRFENFREKTGEVKVTGLERGDGINLTISWDGDTSKYPDNRRFSFDNTKNGEDIKIIKDVAEATIAKRKESWFKNENGQLVLVDAKDKGQIAKENELTEVRRILKELGLEKLEIGDIVDGKRKQTYISISNTSDLKKIQFKELGGVAEYTSPSSLGGIQKITVYLDWVDNEKKFPKKMKISFSSQGITIGGGFVFGKTGKKSIIIPQKTLANQKNTEFKLEQQGNKWYLVEVTS